jgi:hypothetical protein
MRNRAIGWKVMWEVPPCASITIQVEDSIHHFTALLFDFATSGLLGWNKRLKDEPFGVCDIS